MSMLLQVIRPRHIYDPHQAHLRGRRHHLGFRLQAHLRASLYGQRLRLRLMAMRRDFDGVLLLASLIDDPSQNPLRAAATVTVWNKRSIRESGIHSSYVVLSWINEHYPSNSLSRSNCQSRKVITEAGISRSSAKAEDMEPIVLDSMLRQ